MVPTKVMVPSAHISLASKISNLNDRVFDVEAIKEESKM